VRHFFRPWCRCSDCAKVPRRELEVALDALADVVVKAQPGGEDYHGFVTDYISGTGAIHRAIPILARHGIHVRPGGIDSRLSTRLRPEEAP